MLHELIENIPPEYRAAIFLWAYTGLRAGEAWGLQVRDLHLDNKRVEINRQLCVCKENAIVDDNHKYTSGHAHPVGVCLKCPLDARGNVPKEIPFGTRIRLGLSLRPTKVGRVKTLDLHSFVVDELRKHLEIRNAQRPDDWLFVDQHQRRTGRGLPINHTNWYGYHFKPVIRMLEWEDEITVHHLRHFCGSYHLMLGVKPFVVQQMLDHSDAEMTRLYSHIIKGMASESFGAIEEAYEQKWASDNVD
jgi:integrase